MYWLYFFLLVIAISTPIFIEGEALHLSEDVREASLILIAGTLGFLLFVIKEKSLIRHMREKLWFQQKNSTITKDLSQSYSYIGEVNRKVDIIKEMMRRLVELTDSDSQKEAHILWEILDTVKHLTQAECVSLRAFNKKGVSTCRLEEGSDKKVFSVVADADLLVSEKKFFEVQGIQVFALERPASGVKIFLLLLRKHNDEIDADILSILTDTLALLEKYVNAEKNLV